MSNAAAPSHGRTGRHVGLDRAVITSAAVKLLDESGLAGLTTRALARRLGVQSPTLYWHVKNKEELLDLVADEICRDAFDIDTSQPWQVQLAAGLRQFRQLTRRHRDAARLLRETPPTGPNRRGHIETTTTILRDAGFTDAEIPVIARVLATHVLGSGPTSPAAAAPTGESTAGEFAEVGESATAGTTETIADDEVFDLGCRLLLDGLEAHLSRTTTPTPAS